MQTYFFGPIFTVGRYLGLIFVSLFSQTKIGRWFRARSKRWPHFKIYDQKQKLKYHPKYKRQMWRQRQRISPHTMREKEEKNLMIICVVECLWTLQQMIRKRKNKTSSESVKEGASHASIKIQLVVFWFFSQLYVTMANKRTKM